MRRLFDEEMVRKLMLVATVPGMTLEEAWATEGESPLFNHEPKVEAMGRMRTIWHM